MPPIIRKKPLLWPGIYFLLGLAHWILFFQSPPDALANLWLLLWVLPLTALDVAIIQGDVIQGWAKLFHAAGLPDGYYLDHAYWYFPRLALMTGFFYAPAFRRSGRGNHCTYGCSFPLPGLSFWR